MSPCT
jgi:hypothetical protein